MIDPPSDGERWPAFSKFLGSGAKPKLRVDGSQLLLSQASSWCVNPGDEGA